MEWLFDIAKNKRWTYVLDVWTDDLLETIQYPEKKMTFRKFLLGHYRAAICRWDWQGPYRILNNVSAAQKVKTKLQRVEDRWMVLYLLNLFKANLIALDSWVNGCEGQQRMGARVLGVATPSLLKF